MKQLRRRGGITPFAVLERRHAEVQEHAEPQIDELLLQIAQRPSPLNHTRCLMRPVILFGSEGSAGEHGQSCSFGGQSKKISSCRHARKSGILRCYRHHTSVRPEVHPGQSDELQIPPGNVSAISPGQDEIYELIISHPSMVDSGRIVGKPHLTLQRLTPTTYCGPGNA